MVNCETKSGELKKEKGCLWRSEGWGGRTCRRGPLVAPAHSLATCLNQAKCSSSYCQQCNVHPRLWRVYSDVSPTALKKNAYSQESCGKHWGSWHSEYLATNRTESKQGLHLFWIVFIRNACKLKKAFSMWQKNSEKKTISRSVQRLGQANQIRSVLFCFSTSGLPPSLASSLRMAFAIPPCSFLQDKRRAWLWKT